MSLEPCFGEFNFKINNDNNQIAKCVVRNGNFYKLSTLVIEAYNGLVEPRSGIQQSTS